MGRRDEISRFSHKLLIRVVQYIHINNHYQSFTIHYNITCVRLSESLFWTILDKVVSSVNYNRVQPWHSSNVNDICLSAHFLIRFHLKH